MSNTSWGFAQIWNQSLDNRPERTLEKRDHVWASELGGAMVDRWLKMNAVEPTNPPNMRSLRKFEAGNIWEWIVGLVLKRANVLLDTQEWVEYQHDNLPRVTGKLDFLAGGKPDWEKAKADLAKFDFPDFIMRAASGIVSDLQESYPKGLKQIVLEIKSCSSFMFEKYERTNLPSIHHALQTFHYLKAKGMQEGHIVYVSKDDCRLIEFGVFNPSPLEDTYLEDLAVLGEYLKAGEQPPLEPEMEFDEEDGRFSPSWRVMYSNYLTKLYGYKNQKEFEDKYRPLAAQWNRVVKRILDGKDMTEHNKNVIKEIRKSYPNFDSVVEKIKEKEVNDADI